MTQLVAARSQVLRKLRQPGTIQRHHPWCLEFSQHLIASEARESVSLENQQGQ